MPATRPVHRTTRARGQVSPEAEWCTARRPGRRLPAWWRMFGWDDLVFTHISARVPGREGDQFLINPYGLHVRGGHRLVPGEGRRPKAVKLEDTPFEVNPAGFTIHSAVHAARHDARLRAAHAFAQRRGGVGAAGRRAAACRSTRSSCSASLGYHDYEGVGAARRREAPAGAATWADKTHFLMLRNHGLLTVGAQRSPTAVSGDVFLRDRLHDPGPRPGRRWRTGACASTRPSSPPHGKQSRAGHARSGRVSWPGPGCCGGWTGGCPVTTTELAVAKAAAGALDAGD
jgi:ribulose-5-phosphate 4-epimerase/fuculose-1-phosphate aldolase